MYAIRSYYAKPYRHPFYRSKCKPGHGRITSYNVCYTKLLRPLVQVNARGKNLISISGVVRSGKTQKVIPYANVFIPYQTTGTITNSEGRFNFFIPMDLGVDSIVVSCLGYYQQSISIEKFLVNSVEIQLEPQKFQINELIVRRNNFV